MLDKVIADNLAKDGWISKFKSVLCMSQQMPQSWVFTFVIGFQFYYGIIFEFLKNQQISHCLRVVLLSSHNKFMSLIYVVRQTTPYKSIAVWTKIDLLDCSTNSGLECESQIRFWWKGQNLNSSGNIWKELDVIWFMEWAQTTLKLQVGQTFSYTIVRESAAQSF